MGGGGKYRRVRLGSVARRVSRLRTGQSVGTLGRCLGRLGPTSVTRLLRRVRSRQGQVFFFELLAGRGTTRAFIRFSDSARRGLVSTFSSTRLGRILSRLCTSSTTSVIRRVPTSIIGEVLGGASLRAEGAVGALLGCPSSSTNSVVAARFISLGESVAIRSTFGQVEQANISGRAVCAYCVASTSERLLNIAAIGRLLLRSCSSLVRRFVRAGIVSMGALSSRRGTSNLLRGCSFLTLPIISVRGELINVVAVSSTLSILRRRGARSVRGVGTVIHASRGPCLGVNIFSA